MTMRRSRAVIAVALVATALVAGRGYPAAPTTAPARPLASGLINRLSSSFRRVVIARLYRRAVQECRAVDMPAPVAPVVVAVAPINFSPFHFRLPPPLA